MPERDPNRRGHLLASLASLLTFILSACQSAAPKIALGDGGLLSGQPCGAPCFWNVTPGLTTRDRAIPVLGRYGASGYRQEGEFVTYGSAIYLRLDANGIVDDVTFMPDPPISLGAVIAKFGAPDVVQVRWDPTSLPEHPMFDLALYYDALHMILAPEPQEAWPAPVLAQDTSIREVTYLAEGAYAWAREVSGDLTQWKGYGSYEDPDPLDMP